MSSDKTNIFILLGCLILSGCSDGAKKFAGPDKSAPTWDLNVGKWEGSTNNLIRPPQEASNGRVGF